MSHFLGIPNEMIGCQICDEQGTEFFMKAVETDGEDVGAKAIGALIQFFCKEHAPVDSEPPAFDLNYGDTSFGPN